jgi:NAD(P)-dependent dehydrogenase (short-subunit alcohol dehydrogenase family)
MNTAKFDFSGSQVLVTGGSNGIGNAIAIAFRDAGADVTITGRNADGKYDTDIKNMRYQALDMRDKAGIEALAKSLPKLNVLVNCAGIAAPGGKSEYDPDVFAETLAVNLTGSFRMATAVLPQLTEAKGCVINTASMSSYSSLPAVPGYGASKAGVVQMTMTLAESWARFGVRVNAFAPGWVSTNMTRGAENNEAYSKRLIEHTPMRRWGKPAEMAGTALFLASDAASFITGVTISVDGGFKAVM